jgi:hypothetical protein
MVRRRRTTFLRRRKSTFAHCWCKPKRCATLADLEGRDVREREAVGKLQTMWNSFIDWDRA